MPTLTFYSDNLNNISIGDNLFSVGHFYMKLEGGGLDQGVLGNYNPDQNNSVILGFYKDGIHNDEGRLNTALNSQDTTVISKSFSLSDQQYEAAKNAAETWIANNPLYRVNDTNCVDFGNYIYSAAGLAGNLILGNFSESELSNMQSGAAYYANSKYGTGDYTLLSYADVIGDLWYGTNDPENSYLEDRSFNGDDGQKYTYINTGVDKVVSNVGEIFTFQSSDAFKNILTSFGWTTSAGDADVAAYINSNADNFYLESRISEDGSLMLLKEGDEARLLAPEGGEITSEIVVKLDPTSEHIISDIKEIKQPDGTVIAAGQIGGIFGSQFGQVLGGNNVFARIGAATVGSLIGRIAA